MTLYEKIDLIIKAIALVGATITVILARNQLKIAISNYKHASIRARHAYMDDFYNQFLGFNVLNKRAKVADFWSKYLNRDPKKCLTINIGKIGDMANKREIDYILMLKNNRMRNEIRKKESELLAFLEATASIQYDDILEDVKMDEIISNNSKEIKMTQEILNKYEHLGTLYEGGAIEKEDIKRFYYTMIADTFVLTLPYILYRRKKKFRYAQKLQNLISIVPYLSGDPKNI